MIEYTEIDVDGNLVNLTEEELRTRARNAFFTWIHKVGEICGWSNEETADRISDRSWFFCYDDGMSPEAAVAEAKTHGIV